MANLSRGSVVALCAASAAAGAAAAAAGLLLYQQQYQKLRQRQPREEEEEQQQEEIAESCPGPESQTAGLAAGCEGCPGRSLCLAAKGGDAAAAAAAAAGAAAAGRIAPAAEGKHAAPRPPKNPDIAEKLMGVKRKVVILSGKGGVGKSTVASQLGFTVFDVYVCKADDFALWDASPYIQVIMVFQDSGLSAKAWALNEEGFSVGLCDLDFCGPSIPLMVAQKEAEIFQSAEGWEPAFVRHDFCVMSIGRGFRFFWCRLWFLGFLLPDEDSAVIWRGPKKNLLIKTFLGNVRWGDLDFLIIDTPPGTSDEHISLASMLDADGALVITTPQEAALQDVRKQINFW
ncbi:hypothetical protein ACSSS7_003205 [Eimeria intestinalis]